MGDLNIRVWLHNHGGRFNKGNLSWHPYTLISQEKSKVRGKTYARSTNFDEARGCICPLLDKTYQKKEGRAIVGVVILNPLGEKVMERGVLLQDVHSNNEAEYAILILGLEWCLANGITCLNVYRDSMLIVKHI